MSRVSNQNFDYITKDYEAFRQIMLDKLGILLPEYTDRSQTDAGIVLIELMSMGLDILSYYQDSLANEVYLSTAQLRSSLLKWCYLLDYYPREATPARLKQVFVLTSPQATNYTVPAGTIVKTQGSNEETTIYFETLEDLVIPAGKLGNEKSEDDKYLYQVDIIEGITVYNELLGSSTGAQNQSFKLKYYPVISDSIQLLINEGTGFNEWTRVNNFVDSSPNSLHYKVTFNDNKEAIITFGDGNFGKIPAKFTNGIYCNYRVGGGTDGNVGANKIVLLDSPLALISSTFNPDVPYEYGSDEESLDEIRVNAPNSYRTQWGALTYEDFGDITVLNVPEVQEAESTGTGYDVDIYVILKEGYTLTEDLQKKILDLFDEKAGGRKIVSAGTISVKDAVKVPQTITGTLVVNSQYKKEEVEQAVKDYVSNFFKYGNYHFGTTLSYTELSAKIITTIPGIISFKFTSPVEDIITPNKGEILSLQEITLSTTGGVEE